MWPRLKAGGDAFGIVIGERKGIVSLGKRILESAWRNVDREYIPKQRFCKLDCRTAARDKMDLTLRKEI